MLIYKWINKTKQRFYQIVVQENNINEIEINYFWGSCNTNRGGKKSLFICSEFEAKKEIDKILKRRKRRGYELIYPT